MAIASPARALPSASDFALSQLLFIIDAYEGQAAADEHRVRRRSNVHGGVQSKIAQVRRSRRAVHGARHNRRARLGALGRGGRRLDSWLPGAHGGVRRRPSLGQLPPGHLRQVRVARAVRGRPRGRPRHAAAPVFGTLSALYLRRAGRVGDDAAGGGERPRVVGRSDRAARDARGRPRRRADLGRVLRAGHPALAAADGAVAARVPRDGVAASRRVLRDGGRARAVRAEGARARRLAGDAHAADLPLVEPRRRARVPCDAQRRGAPPRMESQVHPAVYWFHASLGVARRPRPRVPQRAVLLADRARRRAGVGGDGAAGGDARGGGARVDGRRAAAADVLAGRLPVVPALWADREQEAARRHPGREAAVDARVRRPRSAAFVRGMEAEVWRPARIAYESVLRPTRCRNDRNCVLERLVHPATIQWKPDDWSWSCNDVISSARRDDGYIFHPMKARACGARVPRRAARRPRRRGATARRPGSGHVVRVPGGAWCHGQTDDPVSRCTFRRSLGSVRRSARRRGARSTGELRSTPNYRKSRKVRRHDRTHAAGQCTTGPPATRASCPPSLTSEPAISSAARARLGDPGRA